MNQGDDIKSILDFMLQEVYLIIILFSLSLVFSFFSSRFLGSG